MADIEEPIWFTIYSGGCFSSNSNNMVHNLNPATEGLAYTVSSSINILSSRATGQFESCRFKEVTNRKNSRYCEIVDLQNKEVSRSSCPDNPDNIQSATSISHRSTSKRHQRPFLTCRKRLQKSQFCSRRHRPFAHYSESRGFRRRRHTTVAQRKAANVREQKRMMNLKEAYKSLRECLPTLSYERKLSRIDTLRLAIMYITFLRQLVEGKLPEDIEWIETKQ